MGAGPTRRLRLCVTVEGVIRSSSVLVIAALLAACGLDAVGSATLESNATPDGGPPRDSETSSRDAAPQGAQSCTNTATTCTQSLESGWTTLAVAQSDDATCPTNYEATTLEHYGATASDGACTCGCQIDPADPPSCAKGKLSGKLGNSATTCKDDYSADVTGTGCSTLSAVGSLTDYAQFDPLPFTAGTCRASAQKDESKIVETSARACRPSPSCEETLCEGHAPTGFDACIVHDGDVACPSNSPFTKKQVSGAAVSLTCSGCDTCQNSGTCSAATIHYYSDMACNSEVATRPANGTCAMTTASSNANVRTLRYDVTVNATCSSTSSPVSAVTVSEPKTICCR